MADLRAGRGKIRGLRVGCGRPDFDAERDKADWEDPKAAEALAKALGDKDAAARLPAAKGLEHWFGPEIKVALPALIAALAHDDAATRRAAAAALANFHLGTGAAVPALVAALKDKDREVVIRACGALGARGAGGKPAIPVLREVLKAEGKCGEAAAAALVGIDRSLATEVPIAGLLEERASVDGKYRKRLARIEVPKDLAGHRDFRDRAALVGPSPAVAEYRGHKDLPAGHWVYVYPHWYIWGERTVAK